MNSHRSIRKFASLLPLAVASMLSLFAAGCEEEAPIPAQPSIPTQAPTPVQPPAQAQKAITKPAAKPTLTANPNPVEGDSKTTTITWDVAQPTLGEVYVSSKGGPERLLARGHKGSKEINWVGLGAGPHEFRLYEGKEHKTQLASVIVTHTPKKTK